MSPCKELTMISAPPEIIVKLIDPPLRGSVSKAIKIPCKRNLHLFPLYSNNAKLIKIIFPKEKTYLEQGIPAHKARRGFTRVI